MAKLNKLFKSTALPSMADLNERAAQRHQATNEKLAQAGLGQVQDYDSATYEAKLNAMRAQHEVYAQMQQQKMQAGIAQALSMQNQKYAQGMVNTMSSSTYVTGGQGMSGTHTGRMYGAQRAETLFKGEAYEMVSGFYGTIEIFHRATGLVIARCNDDPRLRDALLHMVKAAETLRDVPHQMIGLPPESGDEK